MEMGERVAVLMMSYSTVIFFQLCRNLYIECYGALLKPSGAFLGCVCGAAITRENWQSYVRIVRIMGFFRISEGFRALANLRDFIFAPMCCGFEGKSVEYGAIFVS
jgi:hypothetical protein